MLSRYRKIENSIKTFKFNKGWSKAKEGPRICKVKDEYRR